MGYAEAIQSIAAPINVVWDTLNDIDHTSKWVVGLERAEVTTAGSYDAGSIYKDYNRLGPMLQVTAWHITAFELMSRQVHVSDSVVLPTMMTIIVTPRAEGTCVKMSVEYRFLPQLGFVSRAFETLVMNHLLKSVLGQN